MDVHGEAKSGRRTLGYPPPLGIKEAMTMAEKGGMKDLWRRAHEDQAPAAADTLRQRDSSSSTSNMSVAGHVEVQRPPPNSVGCRIELLGVEGKGLSA